MVDNSELIKQMFYFNENDKMFFHCQIVQRAKDHPEKKVKEGTIRTYFVQSKEHLDKIMPEIKLLCDFYGARAYINVSGKSFSTVNKLMLHKLAEYNLTNIDVNSMKILTSSAGETKSKHQSWVIDIDEEQLDKKDEIKEKIKDLYADAQKLDDEHIWFRDFVIEYEVPTKTGLHYITKPFNVSEFNKEYPDIIVHKNSMGTVLYIPDFEVK